MLFKVFTFVFICNVVSKLCAGNRRIVGGKYTPFDKQYVVYFVKSNQTPPKISGPNIGDYWLCGGAIISPTQILTAAACLLENKNIYAIAGYRRYIRTYDLERDPCTRKWKQRVVKTCVPKNYVFDYAKPNNWLSMDVGVAIVEKPYNFSDLSYRLHCHYVPAPVKILYEEVYQSEGTDVLMLGWGHTKARQSHNIKDLNSPFLREASGVIQSKAYCQSNMPATLISHELIHKYLICVHHAGKIGGGGELLDVGEISNAGCNRRNMNSNDPGCVNNAPVYDYDYYDFRRHNNKTDLFDGTHPRNISYERLRNTRRQGICQNDHGGPLITWVGKEEVLIGVALTALLSDTYDCIGPYIFTSAYCASHIMQCLLATTADERAVCEDKAKENGYNIEEVIIEWEDLTRQRNSPQTGFKQTQTKPVNQETHSRNDPIKLQKPLAIHHIGGPKTHNQKTSTGQVPTKPQKPLERHPTKIPQTRAQPYVLTKHETKTHLQPRVSLDQLTRLNRPYTHLPLRNKQSQVSADRQPYKQYKQSILPLHLKYTKTHPILRNLEPNQDQLYISAQNPDIESLLAIHPEVISQLYIPLQSPDVGSQPRVPWPRENNIFNKATENYYAKIRNIRF